MESNIIESVTNILLNVSTVKMKKSHVPRGLKF
jgi:hypothetical protein